MFTSAVVSIVVRNTIFHSFRLWRTIDKFEQVVVTFEKHTFLSQTDLTRTGIISNSYNEIFEA
jgi:hypothetical protein